MKTTSARTCAGITATVLGGGALGAAAAIASDTAPAWRAATVDAALEALAVGILLVALAWALLRPRIS